MKLTNTDFNMKVNESSSYIVYITKSKEIYSSFTTSSVGITA